jgi:hypothetical protein
MAYEATEYKENRSEIYVSPPRGRKDHLEDLDVDDTTKFIAFKSRMEVTRFIWPRTGTNGGLL